jgi:hypothetical protein
LQEATHLKQFLPTFDDYFEERLAEVEDESKDRWSGSREMWHLTGAFQNQDWQLFGHVKERNVHFDFAQLAAYFMGLLGEGAAHGL